MNGHERARDQLDRPHHRGAALRHRRRHGLHGRPVAPDGRERGAAQPGRVGARWPRLRDVDHVVPAGRGPLHRLHVRRRSCGDVGHRRCQRLLRGAVHDRPLPDHLHHHEPALVGVPPARLRHLGGLRGRPLREPVAVPCHRRHWHRGYHALHRPAACGHQGCADGARAGQLRERAADRPATHPGVRRAGGIHLYLGVAGACDDRRRQTCSFTSR